MELGLEGVQPVAGSPGTRQRSRAASVRDWFRVRAGTTPGRLVLIATLVVGGAVCFGVAATAAEHSREQAASAVRSQTEPLLVQAVALNTALSDANATATTTFLTGGLEPPARRQRYLSDLRVASDALAALTREVGGSSDARTAIATVSEQLPIYSGLIETARANNRQGLPVGAAYLRKASSLLTETILPQASQLLATESRRLSDDYATGTTATALVVLGIAIAVAVGLLVATQLYVARISRRVFNVPIVLATLLLVVVSIWSVAGVIGEQNGLVTARRASDSVAVLSATRVLLSRGQTDRSLTLVSRGSDETDPLDLAAVRKVLAPTSSLLAEVAALARPSGTTAAAGRLPAEIGSYLASGLNATAADRVSADLGGQIDAAQSRFAHAAADATSSLSGLSIAIPALTAIVAALALVGLRQRLGEYR